MQCTHMTVMCTHTHTQTDVQCSQGMWLRSIVSKPVDDPRGGCVISNAAFKYFPNCINKTVHVCIIMHG